MEVKTVNTKEWIPEQSEFYKIVANEFEMKWFFDHVLEPPEVFETYIVCLSARAKKLTAEEREIYKLGRGELMRTEIIRRKGGDWNFNIYKQAPYKYNCHKSAMLTKSGFPYPGKCLVCYAYVNPSDELNCVENTVEFYRNIEKELIKSYRKGSKDGVEDHLEKLPKIFEHLRSCHATNISRRIWRDFDCDLDFEKIDELHLTEETARYILYTAIKTCADETYGKGNYVVVDTSGGFHTLVRITAIKSNPNEFIAKVKNQKFDSSGFFESKVGDFIKEMILTEPGSQFLPLPGTLQYGRLVRIINKEDLES